MGSVVVGKGDRCLRVYPAFLLNSTASRRHGRPSWRTTNPRRKRKKRWRQKRKKLGAQVKLHRPNPGRPGRVGNWVSLLPVLSQMRSERRAAAVRKKAARMNAQAARVNGRRVTGMRGVTRVLAARTRAVRMRPGLPGTKRRSLAVMRIQRMLTLMMRTEDGPTAVTMIQRAAVMGVASGALAPAPAAVPAPAAAPALSPVAVSTRPRRMAAKPQLPIPVKLTVTVTESQGLRAGTDMMIMCRKALFQDLFVSLSLLSSKPLLLIKRAFLFPSLGLNGLVLPIPPPPTLSLTPPPSQVLSGLSLRDRSKGHRDRTH